MSGYYYYYYYYDIEILYFSFEVLSCRYQICAIKMFVILAIVFQTARHVKVLNVLQLELIDYTRPSFKGDLITDRPYLHCQVKDCVGLL